MSLCSGSNHSYSGRRFGSGTPRERDFDEDTSCVVHSDRQVVPFGQDSQKLRSIIVRHNLQGVVQILYDSEIEKGFFELTRQAPSQEVLKLIQINHRIHLENHRQEVFILEVGTRYHSSGLILLYGCVAAVVILLVAVVIAICVAYEWRHLSRDNSTALSSTQPSSSRPEDRSLHASASSMGSVVTADPEIKRSDSNSLHSCDSSCVVGFGHVGHGASRWSDRRRRNGSLVPHKVTLLVLSLTALISSAVFAVCGIQELVHVVLHIPSTAHLESVDLFFNIKHRNPVFLNASTKTNGTHIGIYDLSDLTVGDAKFCDAAVFCSKELIAQGLSGCDAASQSCICQRGYTQVNGLCVDVDECLSNSYDCPEGATCNNTEGSFACTCPDGHYLNEDEKCSACSVGCPPEHFELFPCSETKDRICQECKKCTRATYESRPCTGNADRKCIHAVYPFSINESLTLNLHDLFNVPFRRNLHRKRLRVESHSKIVMENLHNNRNLETTYYVTDSKQMTDFYWFRESGIRVNVGLENINLVPVYVDVNHSSDNDFISQNPGNTEGSHLLSDVISNHCRHPMADHYSLTLEIAKDRATRASPVSCTREMYDLGVCPEGIFPNEIFVNRSLNDPCQEMGSFPENLPPASNSIVCTESSALLRDLFNITPSHVRIVTFPSKPCKQAAFACDHCLEQDHCAVTDVLDQKCCQIGCLSMPECRLAMSSQCTEAPVQCAMGDAYRFTLQPVFASLKNEFRCHLRRKGPDFLYQLWFDIIIPGTDIHSPRFKTTVHAGDSSASGSAQQYYQTEFLSVEHSFGIEPEDELILAGQSSNGHWNHSVYSARAKPDVGSKRIIPHMMMSGNAFVVSVQFARPFSYSTSTWVKENGCHKDVQVFRPVLRPQKSDGIHAQPVKVTTFYNDKEHYEYKIKSVQKQPQIKLVIPANVSILSWWFRRRPASLMLTETQPSASLTLSRDERLWQINISGMMTDCPGYISVTINDFLEQEELFNYDLVVPCPRDFQAMFSVPTWGVRQDKTFELILFDAKKTFRIFFTYFWKDSSVVSSGENIREAKLEFTQSLFPIVTLLILFLVMGFCCILKVSLESAKVTLRSTLSVNFHSPVPPDKTPDKHPKAKPLSHLVRHWLHPGYVILVVIRVLYSFLFTFTALIVVTKLFLPSCPDSLVTFIKCREFYIDQSLFMSAVAEDYYRAELMRQAKLARLTWKACDAYIEELMEMLFFKIREIRKAEVLKILTSSGISFTAVFSSSLNQSLVFYRDQLRELFQEYQRSTEKQFQPAIRHYKEYIDLLYVNPWFVFPQILFNLSSAQFSSEPAAAEDFPRGLAAVRLREKVTFTEFLGVHRVESTQQLNRFLHRRFNEILQSSTAAGMAFAACVTSKPSWTNLPYHTNSTRFIPTPPDYNIQSISVDGKSSDYLWELEEASGESVAIHDFTNTRLFANWQKTEASDESCFSLQSTEWTLIHIVMSVVDVFLLTHRFVNLYLILEKFKADARRQLPNGGTASRNYIVLQTGGKNFDHVYVGKKIADNSEVRDNNSVLNDTVFSHDGCHVWPEKAQLIHSNIYSCAVGQNAEQIYCQLAYKRCLVSKTMNSSSAEDQRCRLWFGVICFWIQRLHRTSGVPRYFTACAVILLLCVVERIASHVLQDSSPLDFIFNLWSKLSWIDVSKWMEEDLSSRSTNGSRSMSTLYYKHMLSELSLIETAIQFFQKGFKEGLLSLCIQARSFAPNITCEIPVNIFEYFDWKIPTLPCNFLPIELQPYLSDWFAKSLNDLAEAFALRTQCLATITNTSLNVVSAFLTIVVVLRLLEVMVVHALHMWFLVPDGVSEEEGLESEEECISRPLSSEGSQCFASNAKIHHLNDLYDMTRQTEALQMDTTCSCQTDRTSFQTICFSETDV